MARFLILTSAPTPGYVTTFAVLRNWPTFVAISSSSFVHMTVVYDIFAINQHLLLLSSQNHSIENNGFI